MFKSYRFRIYPSPEQHEQLAKNFGCARFVYNQLVERQTDSNLVGRAQERQMIDELCRSDPWIKTINPSVVFHAFDHFNYTLQRSKNLNQKLRFITRRNRESFCLSNYSRSIRINAKSVAVSSFGDLKARMPRLPDGRILNTTIIKTASGRFYMSILTQQKDNAVLPVTRKEKVHCIGLDMGIKHFLTQSDGVHIENPRYFQDGLERMKHLQKDLARKTKGSANYKKNCQRIARLHERIMTQRNAFLHKESTRIVRENDIIAVETLGVSDMLEQKKISLQINDAAWSKFIAMLTYKAQWYGKQLIRIDRYHPSSKTCCKCRYIAPNMPLNVREWQCPQCETQHDRDTNAAINIMIAGVKLYQKNNPKLTQQLIPVLSGRR